MLNLRIDSGFQEHSRPWIIEVPAKRPDVPILDPPGIQSGRVLKGSPGPERGWIQLPQQNRLTKGSCGKPACFFSSEYRNWGFRRRIHQTDLRHKINADSQVVDMSAQALRSQNWSYVLASGRSGF